MSELTIPKSGSIEEEMVDIIYDLAHPIQTNVSHMVLNERARKLVVRLEARQAQEEKP